MKYVWITIGVLIAIPAILWFVGIILPESHTATVSKTFDANRQNVWNAITNVEDYAAWRSDVSKIEVQSDSSGFLKWKEFYNNNDVITFKETKRIDSTEVVAVIADKDLPFGGKWTYKLEAIESKTKLTITEDGEVYNPIFRFISYFFMSQTATMEQYLSDLENHLN